MNESPWHYYYFFLAITIYVSPTNADTVLNINFLNRDLASTINGTSPSLTITATDPRRQPGWAVFKVSSTSSASINYEISVNIIPPPTHETLVPSIPSGYGTFPLTTGGNSEIATFIAVFLLSLSITISVIFIVKKTRERLRLLEEIRMAEVELESIPIVPPEMYRLRMAFKPSQSLSDHNPTKSVPTIHKNNLTDTSIKSSVSIVNRTSRNHFWVRLDLSCLNIFWFGFSFFI